MRHFICMQTKSLRQYHRNIDTYENYVSIADHLDGFDQDYGSTVLREVIDYASQHDITKIHTGYIFDNKVTSQYKDFKFVYDLKLTGAAPGFNELINYKTHPVRNHKNFVCSFNGWPHVGRKLLVAALKKFSYYNNNYCSKNFCFDLDTLDGHLQDIVKSDERFYRKFFISTNSNEFFQSKNGFGYSDQNYFKNTFGYDRYHKSVDHEFVEGNWLNYIGMVESKLTESFLHIVSETVPTSYYPFITEKFLYSIVTKTLFLSYAHPEWHNHLQNYFGFKKYTKLFNYSFDTIQNPVERLIELMCMISKFNNLSTDDWNDLYDLEHDTIEYNYDHYFSQDYLKCLAKHS